MSNHPNRSLAYACFWISPRGFANEGTYLYGPLAECRRACEPLRDMDDAHYHRVSRHRTLDAAKAAAEHEVRISERRKAWGEQDYTTASSTDDYFTR